MKLVMTLLVRNEQDVLEANLDYHLSRGVDLVVATDNLSEDATPDILERYARQGVLTWRRETDDDYAQSAWVSRMAREAAVDHGADWVINNDADEFWWPDVESLRTYFAQVPDDVGGVAATRYNFPPVAVAEAASAPFHERMTVRDVESLNDRGKRILPKVAHRALPGIVVGQGNHRVEAEGLGPVVPAVGLEVLHFPMRSYRQFENKIANAGRAYERNPQREKHGLIKQHLYGVYREGSLRDYYDAAVLTSEELAEGRRTGRYVEDRRLRDYLASLRDIGSHDRVGARP